jgi:protease-4
MFERASKNPLVWLILLFCLLAIPVGIYSNSLDKSAGDNGDSFNLGRKTGDRLIVLGLTGMIIGDEDNSPFAPTGTANWLKKQLKKACKDKSIKGILLYVNSPGGTVATSQEIYNYMQKLREENKPVVVAMGDVAASGAYYISAPADRIFAEPGTLTGSIGVIMNLMNFHGIEEKLGVEPEVVKSGLFKDIGSPNRAMTKEEKDILQSIIMDSYDQFVTAVATGRHLDPNYVRKIADGRIYSGRQALKVKLVDELGGYDAAIDYLQKTTKAQANRTTDFPVDDKRQTGFWEHLLSASANPLQQANIIDRLLPGSNYNKQPLWLLQ